MNTLGLKKAVEIYKGIKPLSTKTGISANTISIWLLRGYIPTDNVLDFSKSIEYCVTPHELRPDKYPNPYDGLPPEMRCKCEDVAA